MIDFDKLQVTTIEESDKYGKYEIGPVSKGFGSTLVNPLRRVLLSSITGSGITNVKFAGVKHEFATLKGVAEDVLDIVMTIKKMPIACLTDEPQILHLNVTKEGVVKASDFEDNSNVKIVDPDYEIATLSDSKSKLELEITVERGTGYRLADENARKKIGMIPLDTNFSPVERVKFEVVDTRVGRRTDFDKIILEIHTDGTEKPGVCLTEATEILVKMYASLARQSELVARILENRDEVLAPAKEVEDESLPELKIDEIDLPSRALNSLKNAGIETTGQLIQMTIKDVESIEGLGKKSIEDIEKALAKQGLGLKD